MPEAWFINAIAEGLARLFVLRLESTPAADILDGTEQVWVDALWSRPISWDYEQENERIHQGFMRLAAQSRRWPVPADLYEALPPRRQPKELPPPPPTPEQQARRQQNIQKLRAMLSNAKRTNP
jgi:hypothetical protein